MQVTSCIRLGITFSPYPLDLGTSVGGASVHWPQPKLAATATTISVRGNFTKSTGWEGPHSGLGLGPGPRLFPWCPGISCWACFWCLALCLVKNLSFSPVDCVAWAKVWLNSLKKKPSLFKKAKCRGRVCVELSHWMFFLMFHKIFLTL